MTEKCFPLVGLLLDNIDISKLEGKICADFKDSRCGCSGIY